MEMDEEFLELNDLDWFASCQKKVVLHFATAGRGFVPEVIRRSIEDYEEIYDYFFSGAADSDVEIVESNLPSFISGVERDRYLKSFCDVARKGIYSYDFSHGNKYKLIAKPVTPLVFSKLSERIRNIISKAPFSPTIFIDIYDLHKIDADNL
jgi:hypothetical protein